MEKKPIQVNLSCIYFFSRWGVKQILLQLRISTFLFFHDSFCSHVGGNYIAQPDE